MKAFVYFAASECMSVVKIGHSILPERRIKHVASLAKSRLRCLGCVEGTRIDESNFHHRFRKYRIKGEWFFLSWEILDALRDEPRFVPWCPSTTFLIGEKFATSSDPMIAASGKEILGRFWEEVWERETT